MNSPNLNTILEWNRLYQRGVKLQGKLNYSQSTVLNNVNAIQTVASFRPSIPILVDYIEMLYIDASAVNVYIYIDNVNYTQDMGLGQGNNGLNVGALFTSIGTLSTVPALYEYNGNKLRFQLNTSEFGGATVQITDKIPVQFNISIMAYWYDIRSGAPTLNEFNVGIKYMYLE